ncbi:hypothetical protein AAFX91_06730 [Bradyrhizobium sp. 31Argb]|uniref:hypothetical protein n=1 Tax=unclassified Bradyrhizobium TaxID=2631580 RepID=UPI00102E747D|nr:hypothetical protein [Bradyrhizobium sp. Leo170]TAI64461.1 hypothetical protein CWO89_18705 [Bradyrhizobium sp. Leo170]
MNNLQSVILTLSISYALIGALLLVILVYARLPWSAKAIAVVVTSAFYIASFMGVRGLLGWASVDRLPASFKLLQARIVEPHSLEGDPGSIYLWVETLDEDNRPSAIPRAYRIPYSDSLAQKTDKAITEIAAGRPQGGRAADFGTGEGGLIAAAREYITPSAVIETSGGDPSTGGALTAAPGPGDGVSFTPLLPPRMPPKDEQ